LEQVVFSVMFNDSRIPTSQQCIVLPWGKWDMSLKNTRCQLFQFLYYCFVVTGCYWLLLVVTCCYWWTIFLGLKYAYQCFTNASYCDGESIFFKN
jgi:hypothetical protein